MTDWIPIEKFKVKKGKMYLFYHPEGDGRNYLPEWVTVDRGLPSYPRKPTLYAIVDLPTKGRAINE